MRLLWLSLLFFITACSETPFEPEGYKGVCEFDLRVFSDLPQGNYADYKLEWQNNDTQTFGIIKANIGQEMVKKVAWQSDWEVFYQGQWINIVNGASYSTEDGIATTVLGVFQDFVGDVVTVAIGFHDDCGTHYYDTCTVEIVDEE